MVLAYNLLEDRRTIDVIIRKFCFCILKWRKVLRIKIIFNVIGKDKEQKSLIEVLKGTRSRKK